MSLARSQALGDTSAGLELRSKVKSQGVFYPTHFSEPPKQTMGWRCLPWPFTAASSPSLVLGTLEERL